MIFNFGVSLGVCLMVWRLMWVWVCVWVLVGVWVSGGVDQAYKITIILLNQGLNQNKFSQRKRLIATKILKYIQPPKFSKKKLKLTQIICNFIHFLMRKKTA